VYEKDQQHTYTAGQMAVIQGSRFRDAVFPKLAKVGTSPEFRCYDQNVKTEGESKIWQDAMKRPRASLPWMLVSNGKAGYEGPLPASTDEAIKLVDQYAK
jgi:hypothetical protein